MKKKVLVHDLMFKNVPNVFTAGVDILEMVKTDRERLRNFWQALQAFWIKLYGSNKIYMAAINVCSI